MNVDALINNLFDLLNKLNECKLNTEYYIYIRWIPFDEFINIKYLAKRGFGEAYKATWINCYYGEDEDEYEDQDQDQGQDVVLKRIYNSSDRIADILNEVK